MALTTSYYGNAGLLLNPDGTVAQVVLTSPNGTPTIVGASEVGSLVAAGWQQPTQAQLTSVASTISTTNPTFYGGLPSAPSSGGTAEEESSVDYRQQARLLFPWIPDPLLDVFVNAWIKWGDPNLAMAALRQDPRYEQFFPGNRRDDGTLRLTEGDYLSTVEGYNRERSLLGMSTLRTDLQTRLIEGDVSVDEYTSRLSRGFVNLASNIEAVRQDYAERWGATGLSVAALLESYVDPGVSPLEAERRLRVSQIGGEARLRGASLSTVEASLFASYGLDQQAARSVFGEVATQLPTLNQLVQRHNDPDDPFDFADLAEALVVQDPNELMRIGRLFAQDRSMFSSGGFSFVAQGGTQPGLLSR